jgi:hypothetical protein
MKPASIAAVETCGQATAEDRGVMSWASVRCKSHGCRAAAHRHAQLPSASLRTATHRGRATSPHPTSQLAVVWWADVHHRRAAPHRRSPRSAASHRVANHRGALIGPATLNNA